MNLKAVARRTLARDRGEPLDGPFRLSPETFGADLDLCLDAQHRLEGLLRARSAFHRDEAARRPSDGSSALLSAALDSLADNVAKILPTMPSITMLAEAERLPGPLVASAGIIAAIDTYASSPTSIEAFMTMLVSAMKAGIETTQADATETTGSGRALAGSDEPGPVA